METKWLIFSYERTTVHRDASEFDYSANIRFDDKGKVYFIIDDEVFVNRPFKVESQDVCDELALDIQLKNIPCDVKMNLAINDHLQNCETIKFTRTPIECKYDYNILVERWTDCNLSLEDYNRLYSKKFTFI